MGPFEKHGFLFPAIYGERREKFCTQALGMCFTVENRTDPSLLRAIYSAIVVLLELSDRSIGMVQIILRKNNYSKLLLRHCFPSKYASKSENDNTENWCLKAYIRCIFCILTVSYRFRLSLLNSSR